MAPEPWGRTWATEVYSGRRRGSRAVGEKYHAHCGCTVVEVLGDPVQMPGDQAPDGMPTLSQPEVCTLKQEHGCTGTAKTEF